MRSQRNNQPEEGITTGHRAKLM